MKIRSVIKCAMCDKGAVWAAPKQPFYCEDHAPWGDMKKDDLSQLSDENLLDIFDNYSDEHPNFDASFGVSLREYLEYKDELTLGQRDALEQIIKKYRMNK